MKKQHDSADALPVRLILFGDNAFARGFWGRLLQTAADKGAANMAAVLVRKAPGRTDPGVFRLICKGASGTREMTVTQFARAVDPFLDEESFYSLADEPSLTTVLWSPDGTPWLLPNGKLKNEKYPARAQLTLFLFRRFCLEKPGVTIIPSTPERFNGRELKKRVREYADLRGLGMDFLNWLNLEVRFVNTLAQSTVEGFDGQCVRMENFQLLVTDYADALIAPWSKTVKDMTPYYTAKRFLYDGALASSCAYSLLHGVNTVTAFMAREKLAKHMRVSVFEEIIPTLHSDFALQQEYALDMFNRFSNPNVTVPWETDNLPARVAESLVPLILAYTEKEIVPPRHLTFAVACTIVWMRAHAPENTCWRSAVDTLLADTSLWGADLTFLARDIRRFVEKIEG